MTQVFHYPHLYLHEWEKMICYHNYFFKINTEFSQQGLHVTVILEMIILEKVKVRIFFQKI